MGTLNLEIEIPESSIFRKDEIREMVTEYLNKLLGSKVNVVSEQPKKYKHEFMAGIIADGADADSLRDGYIQRKYGL